MVNLAQHSDCKKVEADLTLSQALSGTPLDPGVGKFLEFRVVRNPTTPDQSQVPDPLIPNPDLSNVPLTRTRTFEFASAGQTSNDPITSFVGPWGIGTDDGDRLNADFGRISAAPTFGTRAIW